MLKDILQDKKCFKLVCGAGNEDKEEVEKLVYLYSLAGCNFFDLSAKPEIVLAAKRGLQKAGIKKDRYLCVSVGIQGDPHVSKAELIQNKCSKCKSCIDICPQNAIENKNENIYIQTQKCIGCSRCVTACKSNAIFMNSEYTDMKEVLPPIIQLGIDCIEFHILGENIQEMDEKWNDINSMYNGILSICADRAKFGNEKILSQIKKMLSKRHDYTTIIQADGAPMSGGTDDYKTTLQAVAMGEIIQNAQLPVYILLSGGTNSKTKELSKLCNVDIHGVAIGSYARKIVKEYIENKNFYSDPLLINKSVSIAKELVNSVLL